MKYKIFGAGILLLSIFLGARITGAAMSDQEFIMLFQNWNPREIKAAIEAGANVNARIKALDEEGGEEWTPLMMASAWGGDLEILSILLRAGADVNARDDDGRGVLACATIWGGPISPEIVATLLEAGADVDARDNEGETALTLGIYKCSPEVVTALIEGGADVNALNNAGETALMRAAWCGKYEMLPVLLAAGADINAASKSGRTALMLCVLKEEFFSFDENDQKVLPILLKAGADAKARDKDGKSVMDYADENPEVKGTDAYRLLKEASK
ncbi:MAG: ankyrin repeat domain-containing protein [Synergistaceae bacterium]|jgi:ankyrin repeat protein|nr:ankyrin repeat domain-containing protein [Synergistaceae bacterium]